MNSTSDSSIPADLLELKARFEAWRQTRKSRVPIPEELRQAALKLLDRYAASTICRVCRLHPRTLQTSATSNSARAPAQAKTVPAFFPLSAPSQPRQAAADCRLVLERADGTRLTLALASLDAALLTTLCTNFLRG